MPHLFCMYLIFIFTKILKSDLAYNKLNKLIKNKYKLILVGDPLDRAALRKSKTWLLGLSLKIKY